MFRFKYYYYYLNPNDLGYKLHVQNFFEIPVFQKIVCATTSKFNKFSKINILISFVSVLELVCNQYPQISYYLFKTKKLRVHTEVISLSITLRNLNLYLFWDNLVSVALLFYSNFCKFTFNSLNERGLFSFCLKELFIFPNIEVQYQEFIKDLIFNVCIMSNKKNLTKNIIFFSSIKFPIKYEKI